MHCIEYLTNWIRIIRGLPAGCIIYCWIRELQCCSYQNHQDHIYVVNWHFSTCPDSRWFLWFTDSPLHLTYCRKMFEVSLFGSVLSLLLLLSWHKVFKFFRLNDKFSPFYEKTVFIYPCVILVQSSRNLSIIWISRKHSLTSTQFNSVSLSFSITDVK